nr:hypothetical protein [Tanacetum cinerariifolium]
VGTPSTGSGNLYCQWELSPGSGNALCILFPTRGCTLGLLGHAFNIDLMPVELGSFDVVIVMDWLANHHAVIIYDEKIMRIPYGDEVLIVQGDRGGKGEKSKLSIISCTKTQKYIKRGYSIFLAEVTKKETEDKLEEKQLEDVPINSSTRSQQAATRNRGKAIVNSSQPIYDQQPSMVAEDDKTLKDKEIDKLMALISLSFKKIYKPTNNNLRTSSNTSRANQDNSPRINRSAGYETQRIGNVAGARETVSSTVVQKSGIQCYNFKEFRHVARECQKPKRLKDAAYHREKMLLYQELEAHYMYMAQLQEVSLDAADSGPIFDAKPLQNVLNDDQYNVFTITSAHPEQSKYVLDTYPIEQDAHNVIIDSLDMSYNREEIDQNDDDNDLSKERELFASLIEKLKCEIDESKNRNIFLKTSNKVLVEKLKGVILTTSVSRPQLKSNPMGDRFMRNNSQGKKQEVEDQRRNVKLPKNKTSISAFASESNQKPRNITRKLYERVSKTCSWWYPKFTPLGYIWKPKSGKENVNPNVSMLLGNASRTANVMDSMTSRRSTVSNTPLSSNSFAARRDCPIYRRLWNDILVGLLKLNLVKDHLCSSCELGKAKQKSFHTKLTPSSKRRLQLLRIDLCGPMRVASINGKRYALLIVDDYSRYTWTHFLRSKDKTPEVLIDFLRLVQRGLQAQVRVVRTDKGTEFLDQTLLAYFAAEGIHHQTSVVRTPEQNRVVERRNRTLVEAARTMLSAAKVPLFFWAEAIATTCFTQNRSLVIPRHEKTPYHIINDRKLSIKFFHIFGSLCYIVRDGENLDKMKEKGDACIFVGYSTQSRAYKVYNKRTRVIMESIHVNFDELSHMVSDHVCSDPAPECQRMALEHDSLSPGPQHQENVTQVDKTVTTLNELDLLFSLMFDELLNGSSKVVSKSSAVSTADAPNQRQQHTTPLNTHTTPVPTCQVLTQVPTVASNDNINQAEMVEEYAQVENDKFINIFYHPLEQVIGNPSQSVRTRRQLESNGEMCMFALTMSRTEPKNIKEAMADSAWIESMQEELHQFDRLKVRNKREKDKIKTKPDKNGKRGEARKSLKQLQWI